MIVCADDFGLSSDIDRAILQLSESGRISAVSCMVGLSHFDRVAFSKLLRLGGRVDIGLHLTLTDIPPLHAVSGVVSLLQSRGVFHPMDVLLRRGVLGRIKPDDVTRETQSQYDRFIQFAGRPPDYLDSHLHIHQFPGVREGILKFLDGMGPEAAPYVRNSAMTLRKIIRQGVSPLKCMAIGFLGNHFRKALQLRGLKTNDGFAGIYAYDGHRAYPEYLRRFVDCMESRNGILMTHPGESEAWRKCEYKTLLESDNLPGLLNRFGG
ncbi:MAG: ChbG/HpnK family deacetylase [bacterium]